MKQNVLLAVVMALALAVPGVAGAQATIADIDPAVVAASLGTAYGMGLPDDVDDNGIIDTEDLQCFVDTFLGNAGMEAAYATNYSHTTVDGGPLASSFKVDVIVAMFACLLGADVTDDFLDGMEDFGALGGCAAGFPSDAAACYDFSQANATSQNALNACLGLDPVGGEGEDEGEDPTEGEDPVEDSVSVSSSGVLYAGGTSTVSASSTDALDLTFTWSSSDETVATVAAGVVTGI